MTTAESSADDFAISESAATPRTGRRARLRVPGRTKMAKGSASAEVTSEETRPPKVRTGRLRAAKASVDSTGEVAVTDLDTASGPTRRLSVRSLRLPALRLPFMRRQTQSDSLANEATGASSAGKNEGENAGTKKTGKKKSGGTTRRRSLPFLKKKAPVGDGAGDVEALDAGAATAAKRTKQAKDTETAKGRKERSPRPPKKGRGRTKGAGEAEELEGAAATPERRRTDPAKAAAMADASLADELEIDGEKKGRLSLPKLSAKKVLAGVGGLVLLLGLAYGAMSFFGPAPAKGTTTAAKATKAGGSGSSAAQRTSTSGVGSTAAEVSNAEAGGGSVTASLTGAGVSPKGSASQFSLRPVLCYAPPLYASVVAAPTTLPACEPGYNLAPADLRVVPSSTNVNGYVVNSTIGADPLFGNLPSTTTEADQASATVLLHDGNGDTDPRYVLGPAGITPADVASATVVDQNGDYVVDLTMTSAGAVALDALERQQFHAFVAVVEDDTVIVSPLVEPTSRSFVPFHGRLVIDAQFTQSQAHGLASDF